MKCKHKNLSDWVYGQFQRPKISITKAKFCMDCDALIKLASLDEEEQEKIYNELKGEGE